MADDDEKGLQEAHTPGKSGGSLDLDGAVARIAQALEPDGDGQFDLLTGSPDLGADDLLSVAAEPVSAKRRGAGRPKGSTNRRNADVFDYLEALGHRDPAVTLSLIQSADTAMLARALACDKVEAARLQVSAAKELMPYKYSKKPQAHEVKAQHLHMFMSGEFRTDDPADAGGTMSIFGDADPDAVETDAPQPRETDGEE